MCIRDRHTERISFAKLGELWSNASSPPSVLMPVELTRADAEATRPTITKSLNALSTQVRGSYQPDESILSQSGAHFDAQDNILVQVIGEKTWHIVAPANSGWMYPTRLHYVKHSTPPDEPERLLADLDEHGSDTNDSFSPVDMLDPDLETYPRFEDAKPTVCTVRAGEMIFVPAFAYHTVVSRPESKSKMNVALNYWFEPNESLDAYHNVVHQQLVRAGAKEARARAARMRSDL
eukprot:TRINITY_DN4699_c0_g1_i1.p1 TRINITY_DN4699_c0_g1~~TRINITY_DN4699_c0_g1_i1.p1  ORF type:complete len:235 (-),score=37.71 TRINITY_DN4699_c0_g1_i1:32-736(-)